MQRRVSHAEIVEMDLNAPRTQIRQHGCRHIDLGDQGSLGDFEIEMMRVESRFCEHRRDTGEEIGAIEVFSREINAERKRVAVRKRDFPTPHLTACLTQDPTVQWDDQSRFLSQRDKLSRGHLGHVGDESNARGLRTR